MALDSQQNVDISIVVRKRALMIEICLISLTLNYQSNKTYCIFFAWAFYHFTCFTVLEGDIVRIRNYDYDKYFKIAAWGKSGGTCDAKVKDKFQ